jgi:hypothetical protein
MGRTVDDAKIEADAESRRSFWSNWQGIPPFGLLRAPDIRRLPMPFLKLNPE